MHFYKNKNLLECRVYPWNTKRKKTKTDGRDETVKKKPMMIQCVCRHEIYKGPMTLHCRV